MDNDTKQINLKLPKRLIEAAEKYVLKFGYRNLQELAAESMREKIFEKDKFDNSFTEKEVELIDSLIELSLKKKALISEKELSQILLR